MSKIRLSYFPGLEVRRCVPVWYTGTSLVGLKSYHHLFLADCHTCMPWPLNSCKILVQIGLYCSLCNAWNLVSLLLGKSLKLVTPDQCNSSYGFLVTVRITVSNFCIFSYSYFLPARCYASTGNSDSNTCPSVRLSVRLSVTRRYCVKTRKLAAWFLQHLVAPTL